MSDVSISKLRPEEVIKRRERFHVAYIPLGTREWHGLHNPMGADGLQAEEISIRCAKKAGGVVFPTVYYGESRVGSLLETDKELKNGVAKLLGLDQEQLSEQRFPYSAIQQIEHYQHHLLHILSEVAAYGFELSVFVVGHYPLLDHARAAILTYNQWLYDKPWKKMIAWAFSDYKLLTDKYENPGDHAGGWETSHLLASHPRTVDLSKASDSLQFGIMTTRNPKNSTAEFGNEIYDAAVERAIEIIKLRISNLSKFSGHGID